MKLLGLRFVLTSFLIDVLLFNSYLIVFIYLFITWKYKVVCAILNHRWGSYSRNKPKKFIV